MGNICVHCLLAAFFYWSLHCLGHLLNLNFNLSRTMPGLRVLKFLRIYLSRPSSGTQPMWWAARGKQDRSRFPQHTMPLWPMVSFRLFCFRTEAGLAEEALSCCANYRLTLPDRAMSSWRHFMARQVLAVAPRRSSLRLMPFWQTRDSNRILILLGLACWASR